MLLRSISFLLSLVIAGFCFGANYPVQLGEDVVTIQVIENGPGKVFLHVHQNETTALAAAKKIIEEQHGQVITLKHRGHRNIQFKLNHQKYEFDPNRIFTDKGIKKTLSNFGPYNQSAHAEVKKLAYQIKKLLPESGKIIAVHNNRHYSLKDYLPGHHLEKDAKSYHYVDKSHYRNFFLVTQEYDYTRLKSLQFNSILQSSNATDDGSLSVYLATRNYVNVEAGFNELQAQIDMLRQA